MRVFIYEYICGGGLAGQPLPESLACEGWAMLASIVEDFARVEGCEVVTTLDERFAGRPLAAQWVERIVGNSEQRVIERLAAECDWSLVIAPEFDGILLDRVRWVEAAGGRLLGPTSAAVATTSDKWACNRRLEQSGVSAPAGRIVRPADGLPGDCSFPSVFKPRDGAGSQLTFLVRDAQEYEQARRETLAAAWHGEFLLQPFVTGLPASVSFLVGPSVAVPLLAGEQLLSTDGRFQYLGGRIPLATPLATRAIAIAKRAIATVPGLYGFVGVDLVLGNLNATAGNQLSACETQYSIVDVVIEINPRLTTSYVGLRALSIDNLAERMLSCCAGLAAPPIRWKPDSLYFRADGTLA